MASLETLFIEIDGNASKASSGIDTLIGSLSSLGSEIGKQIGSIRQLASALGDIRGATVGGNIWKNLTPQATVATRGIRAVATETQKAGEQIKKTWAEIQVEANPQNYKNYKTENLMFGFTPTKTPYSQTEVGLIKGTFGSSHAPGNEMTVKQFYDQLSSGNAFIPGMQDSLASSYAKAVMDRYGENANWQESAHSLHGMINQTQSVTAQVQEVASVTKEATAEVKNYDNAIEETKSETKEATKEIEKYEKEVEKTTKQTTKLAKTSKELGKAGQEVKKTHSATKGLLSQIGRIAKTMLIRTAIRSLMKVAKEGLNNFYEYSKKIGSGYAAAIDSMKTSAGTAGNQIGAALGTLLTTIMPIVNTIVSVVSAAAEALTMLFSLLGGGTTYTKAVNGFNSVSSAAGGAGKKIKELLADFDELNVISQESGGGGGGGGGVNVGGMFEEADLPQWMLEWKPLIEALAVGGLGALLLPALLKLLGNLFGGSDWLDILKHYFKKDWLPDDDDIIPDNTDYKQFPEQPDYKPFPVQPEYHPFPAAPDYSKAAADMGILAGAAVTALPAVEGIVAALEKLKTGLSLMDLLKTLLTTLISRLGGSTIKVKVDRKEFDEFKKEFDEWNKEKNVILDMDIEPFRTKLHELRHWMEEKLEKVITVGFDRTLEVFNFTAKGISNWVKSKETKAVSVGFDKTLNTFNFTAKGISNWVKSKETKAISVGFDNTLEVFNFTARGISTWTSDKETKVIDVDMNNGYQKFLLYSKIITAWANTIATKAIEVVFSNYTTFLIYAGLITAYANTVLTKEIEISFSNWASFILLANAIDAYASIALTKQIVISISNMSEFLNFVSELNAWAAESLVKTVTVVTKEVKETTTTTSNGSGGVFSNNIIPTAKSATVSTNKNSGGILQDAWNGVTNFLGDAWNTVKNALGFRAEGGYDIPRGELFIAQEAGAELIGSINGKTSVANQQQIIEGISRGVSEGQAEQNMLLRQQNELLRGILEKDASVKIGASAMFGREVKRSLDMYAAVGG